MKNIIAFILYCMMMPALKSKGVQRTFPPDSIRVAILSKL
jgi:hypothetical protein